MSEKMPNSEKGPRIVEVRKIVEGLVKLDNKEVASAQEENLHQYEATDVDGNELTIIRDNNGNLAHPFEVRNNKGVLIAQSWDMKNWAVDKYIEAGVDFSLDDVEAQ